MERDPEHLTDREHLTEEEKAEHEIAAHRNPDELTRRETLELDLMEEGKSEAGEEIGDEAG